MKCCSIPVRIAIAVTGVILGLAAGVVFGIKLKNYDASAFGTFSGVIAAITVWVHVKRLRSSWTCRHISILTGLMYTGCFVQLIGVSSFIVYIVLGSLYQSETLLIEGRSHFLTCVWSFMTWKWGFNLFWFSRMYKRELVYKQSLDTEPILD